MPQRWSRRTRALIGLPAIAIVAGMFYYVSLGERAFGRTAAALRAARFYRAAVSGAGRSGDSTIDVECPDRFRVSRPAHDNVPALEYVVVGSKAFARTEEGPWREIPRSLVTLPRIRLCSGPSTGGDGGDPQDLAAAFEQVADKGTVEPDGHGEVGGRDCDRWVARGRGLIASMSELRFRVCVDPTTNLPVEMSLSDTRWTFSRWNEPRSIDIPSPAAPSQGIQ